ncbi:bifunctional diguanylate cyclase/phosphodiesterase [Persephonella sp. KM09-Lau-8]|uniref:putative bifunctional diguanylate cyclase/phosphodiesterase n=1 Tax=Persephonella sp. KM09-Lau-8 TaxID=1158345 RepID=UPI0004955741|nr:bifunctional diguanylate cyclase/phosphodiesterase [Persephonella sp. KM09-Lau-8]
MVRKDKRLLFDYMPFFIVLLGLLISVYIMAPKIKKTIEDSIIKEAVVPGVVQSLDKIIRTIQINAKNKDLESLFSDPKFRKKIRDQLSVIVTDDVKYAYILYKDKDGKLRYLIDLSKEDRARFREGFNIYGDYWDSVLKDGKSVVIKQSDYTGLWITLLKPIKINHKVAGIAVIEFSVKKLKEIQAIISKIQEFVLIISLFIVVSIVISLIQFIKYRENVKKMYIDPLTGAYNRLYLYENIEKLKKGFYTTFVIDIDHFKKINDSFGHEAGDHVLKEVTERIKSCIREDDILIRYGGEEFLLFAKINPYSENYKYNVLNLATRIKTEICKRVITYENISMKVTVSIGIAPYAEKSIEEAIKMADMALYKAKKNGRNKIEIYSGPLEVNHEEIYIIKEAIDNNNIVCWYQPIVNLKTGEVLKYEALVRLISKDGKIIYPYQFLNTIRRTYVHIDLTKKVIEYNAKVLKENPWMGISMNLSALDVYDDNIIEHMENVLDKELASRLTIELLESEDIDDYPSFKEKIEYIKGIGCKISIDDFGSGYSNFSHLVELAPDYLKIDGSIIKDIDTNYRSLAIVKAIKSFADDTGIKVIAEYIHSESVLRKVLQLGIIYGQGYYLRKPQPVEKRKIA